MPETFLHLFWGYSVFWLCLALFILFVSKEQRRLHGRTKRLEEELARIRAAGS